MHFFWNLFSPVTLLKIDLMFSWETETHFQERCVEQLLVGNYSDTNKNIHHLYSDIYRISAG